MRLISIDPRAPDPRILAEAASILHAGGLVAFPTETVYGLGANALNEGAVRGIFAAKGRPSFNPLIVHVPDLASARDLSAAWPEAAERAGAAFWPGPLTVVVPKRPEIPASVTAGLGTVAIRVPAHPVARALLEAAELPVAAPSANRYTRVSPTTALHVARGLGDRVDLILDGGPTQVGIESTVVDLSGPSPVLLRPGSIAITELEAVLGRFVDAPTLEGAVARTSPGMVDRHYSPRAELLLFPRERRAGMAAAARDAAERGLKVGGLLLGTLDAPLAERVAMPETPGAYARELYAALHRMDDAGCDLIVGDAVPDGPGWAGVRDRLGRAARRV